MKITIVKKARIDQGLCEFCGGDLPAGESYMSISPRYGGKRKRHTSCRTWRPSEMVGGKIATAMAAQEDASEALEAIAWPEGEEDPASIVETDVKDILEGAVMGAEECRDDYQEGLDNMPEGLQSGPVGEQIEENIAALDDWIDQLQGWENDTTPEDSDDSDSWVTDVIESAKEVVDELAI